MQTFPKTALVSKAVITKILMRMQAAVYAPAVWKNNLSPIQM